MIFQKRECKFCRGNVLLAHARYSDYKFCIHCGAVYEVKQKESSTRLNPVPVVRAESKSDY